MKKEQDYRITVTVRGISPILIYAFHEEEKAWDWRRPKFRSRRESARYSLYRPTDPENRGRIVLPGINLMAALRTAGRKVKYDGRSSITDGRGATRLWGFLSLADKEVALDFGGKSPERAMKADIRRGLMCSGGKHTAIEIVRPRFDEWGFTANLVFSPDEAITLDKVRRLIIQAGRWPGLGSFNPLHGGPFGRFAVTEFAAARIPTNNARQAA